MKRVLVREVRVCYRVAERRACRVLGFARSSFRYKSRRNQRAELRVRLRDLAASRVHYGYQRLWVLLRRAGWIVNKKLVYRLYREEAAESGGESHVGGRAFRSGKHGRRPGRPMRAGAWTSWPISWSAGSGSGRWRTTHGWLLLRHTSKAPVARHLPDCMGETAGPGRRGVPARVPELWRRHPADRQTSCPRSTSTACDRRRQPGHDTAAGPPDSERIRADTRKTPLQGNGGRSRKPLFCPGEGPAGGSTRFTNRSSVGRRVPTCHWPGYPLSG